MSKRDGITWDAECTYTEVDTYQRAIVSNTAMIADLLCDIVEFINSTVCDRRGHTMARERCGGPEFCLDCDHTEEES